LSNSCTGRAGKRLLLAAIWIYVTLAFKGGVSKNPDWHSVIVMIPKVTVEVGAKQFQAKGTVASGRGENMFIQQNGGGNDPFYRISKANIR